MKCRICGEVIIFVKGRLPNEKRRSTFAVHQSRLEDTIKQTQGEIITPHTSYQRRLRVELEELHPPKQNTAVAIERMDTDMDNPNLAPVACEEEREANSATATAPECEEEKEEKEEKEHSATAVAMAVDPFIARTKF